jgi:hypothetical protein
MVWAQYGGCHFFCQLIGPASFPCFRRITLRRIAISALDQIAAAIRQGKQRVTVVKHPNHSRAFRLEAEDRRELFLVPEGPVTARRDPTVNKLRRGSTWVPKNKIFLPHEQSFLTLLPLATTPLRGFSATPTRFFPGSIMEDVLEVYHRSYDERQPVICMDEQPAQPPGRSGNRLL